jgi:hypothetical protein
LPRRVDGAVAASTTMSTAASPSLRLSFSSSATMLTVESGSIRLRLSRATCSETDSGSICTNSGSCVELDDGTSSPMRRFFSMCFMRGILARARLAADGIHGEP